MTLPSEYNATRIVSKNSATEHEVPDISTTTSLYRGELAVNHHTPNNSLVASSAGIFMRVGVETIEDPDDILIRIGPAFVTEDIVTATEPSITFVGTSAANLSLVGQLWYRKTDQQFFLYDGIDWIALTALPASEVLAGLIEIATEAEVLLEIDDSVAVTPSTLGKWRKANDFLEPIESLLQLYVDSYAGNDSIENPGNNQYKPFKTIERACLEVTRVSYVATGIDLNNFCTINVAPGSYSIDNRPGASVYTSLPIMPSTATGPITPRTLDAKVVTYDPITNILTTTSDISLEGIAINDELYSSIGGRAVVVSIASTVVKVRQVSGTFIAPNSLLVPQHHLYNPPEGGVVIPRGSSVVSLDLRKCVIRPRYIGDVTAAIGDVACLGIGRTAIFRVTGGCYIYGMSFKDNLDIKSTHHTCTAIEFASTAQLTDTAYGYYRKVYYALRNLQIPALTESQLQAVQEESQIVGNANSPSTTDADGFPLVDTTQGSSPYVYNSSVRSRFGLQGMKVDGNAVTGFKSMVSAQFTNVSLQVDPQAFEAALSLPGGKRYKSDFWKHKSFHATNGGYAQLVSCFVIGSGKNFAVDNGGEFSITNSCSNFGDTALSADGFTDVVLPQDTGGISVKIVRPALIPTTPIVISTLPFLQANSTSTKLYVDGEINDERISPFTFQPGETIYVNDGTTIYTATLGTNNPPYAMDINGHYFITSAVSNGIFANASLLDGFPIDINRTPDERDADDRIYWLRVDGLTSSAVRPPQINMVLRVNTAFNTPQLQTTVFVADVKNTNFAGADLPNGSYYIALLSATGANDHLEFLYPEVIIDAPLQNPATSLTYAAMNSFLTDIGLTAPQRATALVASSTREYTIPVTAYLQFVRPSIIRASNHTWEWSGYLNYSSSLPKFQDKVFTFEEKVTKVKYETNGGRIYNVGMDEDGNYFIGDKVIDLKTGKEKSTLGVGNDSVVFDNVTVRKKLLMLPNSTLDVRSAKLAIDTRTRFVNPILTTYNTYATTDQAGFIEIATDAEVIAATDTKRAITPSQLPIYVSARLSALIRNIVNVRLSLSGVVATPGSGTTVASFLFLHPYKGNDVAIYDVATEQWILIPIDTVYSFSIAAIGGTAANTNYDIYLYNSGSLEAPVPSLELVGWSNSGAGVSVPPVRGSQDGAITKTGDPGRRLLGVLRTTAAGTTSIDLGGIRDATRESAKCLLANLYNLYDQSFTFFFEYGWDKVSTSFAVPPAYGNIARVEFVLAESLSTTCAMDMYNNAATSHPYYDSAGVLQNTALLPLSIPSWANISYVAVGVDSTTVEAFDSFYGEVSAADTCAVSFWQRTLPSGYHYLQYLYKQSATSYNNEHTSHGIIATLKV